MDSKRKQESCSCTIPSKSSLKRAAIGEIVGTFLMCFLGIGAVATATLYSSHTGPYQVGMVWGISIAIAIYTTRNLSSAHFNPAVTFAMCLSKRCSWKNFPVYIISQLTGAILAASMLWMLFRESILAAMEKANMSMLQASSYSSIWCEVFPNTSKGVISMPTAAFAEGLGVFILIFIIFSLTEGCNVGKPSDDIFPLFIGLTVAVIISTVGPLTDAGLNPARDFGPRIVAYLVGWREIAIYWDAIIVYTIAPFIGAALSSLLFVKVIEPMQRAGNKC